MKRRIPALVLTAILLLGLAVPAAAKDVTWSTDTTLTAFVNAYEHVVVKSGVTVTMKAFQPDPQGLEISGSLTVEPGGRIVGPGTLIFSRSAAASGVDLYYRVGGEERLLPVSLSDLCRQFPQTDWNPHFLWNGATGHYVLTQEFEVDPFSVPDSPGPDGAGGGSGRTGVDSREEAFAAALKQLGLFQGTAGGFELERAPSRTEAVVLLIRLLGKDGEATRYDPERCPFDDVADWARGYLAYAYDTGLAKGVGGGKFGGGSATVQQFLTFVLRAMGYSDAAGEDFTWDHPEDLATRLGVVAGEGDLMNFTRGTCVRIMEAALRNSRKDGVRLYEKLVSDGVFTEEEYRAAFSGS